MAANWIVRHGAMRFWASLKPPKASMRGQEVVIRTERGLEVGDVLCPATPLALQTLAEPTKGRICAC